MPSGFCKTFCLPFKALRTIVRDAGSRCQGVASSGYLVDSNINYVDVLQVTIFQGFNLTISFLTTEPNCPGSVTTTGWQFGFLRIQHLWARPCEVQTISWGCWTRHLWFWWIGSPTGTACSVCAGSRARSSGKIQQFVARLRIFLKLNCFFITLRDELILGACNFYRWHVRSKRSATTMHGIEARGIDFVWTFSLWRRMPTPLWHWNSWTKMCMLFFCVVISFIYLWCTGTVTPLQWRNKIRPRITVPHNNSSLSKSSLVYTTTQNPQKQQQIVKIFLFLKKRLWYSFIPR